MSSAQVRKARLHKRRSVEELKATSPDGAVVYVLFDLGPTGTEELSLALAVVGLVKRRVCIDTASLRFKSSLRGAAWSASTARRRLLEGLGVDSRSALYYVRNTGSSELKFGVYAPCLY